MATETKPYTLSTHVQELVKEICTLHPKDGYDNFETISLFTRELNTNLNFQFTKPQTIIKPLFNLTDKEQQILQSLPKTQKVKIVDHYMDDILTHAKLFEWGGISFSDDEWFKIRIAMKKLLTTNNCVTIRFFGKIYGINSDYYIIQGTPRHYQMPAPPSEEEKVDESAQKEYEEIKGYEGINRYTFWVSNSLLESWYELPDITHEQLRIARMFKCHFTGNLNSKVKSYRPFPGKEMHLLKCQIIRILHSSSIIPSGYLKTNDNYKEPLTGKVAEYNEEYQPPSFDEMKSPEFDKWVHEEAYIFPNGKIIDTSITEGQVDRFRVIAEDEGYKVKEGEGENVNEIDKKYWKIKVVGDQMVHNKGEGDPICHAVILVRNSRWPGTLCVWKEGKFANVYVGFAIKETDAPYSPTQFGVVDKDPEDMGEQKEPNPEKEPPKQEEEKKEGEGEEGEEQQQNNEEEEQNEE